MLISMAPNDEVKTIHASLNDGKLRKWEFEPYTEQGKIELTDQDYATIQSIKGNTIKFNQLVRYTNKENTTVCGLTITNNNNGSFTINGTYNASGDRNMYGYISIISAIQGHKYLVRSTGSFMAGFVFGSASGNQDATTYIVTASSSGNMETSIRLIQSKATNGQVVNETIWINTFDLTLIFGSGNEPTSVSDFETWLSNNIGILPYYDYTQGSLISFNGTGLKTENASQTESNTLSLPISTLFPTGTKEAGTVYDELTSSKATTRLNEVVFNGSEAWSQGNPSQRFYLEGAITDYKDGAVGIATNGWEVVTNNTDVMTGNNKIWFQIVGSTYRINFYANTLGLSNAQEFKEYLASNPLTVVYELATPTEQDISLDLTYPVWNNGTEQILPINGSTPTTSSMKATIEYPDRTEDVNFLYKQTTFDSAIPQFSLVCKNQELPMTLENDKLICECDSSITNESGFFDCKVKMQDLDSVAYSQKIQLHVERGIND